MDYWVKLLYEHGDTARLIEIATRPEVTPEVVDDACRSLRLLARLGDPVATAFCADAGRRAAHPDAA